jgi:dihydrodipicolinate synthase/N-acetylneuraminate lyase
MTAPQGIWGAVLLPVDMQGAIDWAALVEEIDILCASGLTGLYTNGTAGEFHAQTEAEFDRLTDLVAARAGAAGVPFQIGVCQSNPRVARERLARCRNIGAAGAQIILPDWWPPSPPEIDRFIDGMQEAAGDLPLILYNPPHAKVRLSLDQIAALRARAPGLVGAKLPGGDAAWYEERRRLLPGFSVFVAGHTVAFGRPLGADGAYSNVACLSPLLALLHWRLAQDDPPRALDLEARIQAFMQTHVVPLVASHGLSHAALDKLMAAVGGWGPVSERLMWPHVSAPPGMVAAVAGAARALLPEMVMPRLPKDA